MRCDVGQSVHSNGDWGVQSMSVGVCSPWLRRLLSDLAATMPMSQVWGIAGRMTGGPMAEHNPPKLIDQLTDELRTRHYSKRTEQAYVLWVKRYIRFHKMRHPKDMAEAEINAFLTNLAMDEKVSASTQNQALSALLFLYRYVFGLEGG